MMVQRFRKTLEVIASRKLVESARSLLARWNVNERIFLLTVLFLALPEVLGWSQWYSNMGLMFGGVVGVPQSEENKWTVGQIVEVRMTATLYAAYVLASVIGLIVHAYLLRVVGTMFQWDLVSSVFLTSRSGASLRYVSDLVLSTVIVRAVVHALVASQLMPKTFTTNTDYMKYNIGEMKRSFGKEPPLKRYETFAAEPRCNSVAERTLEMCTESDGSGTGRAASAPVCSSLPCSSGEVVDTDAIGGPLSAFKKVLPTPEFTTALPYDDMWRSFYDFPVVFRDIRGTRQAAAQRTAEVTDSGRGHVESNMEDDGQGAILDIDEIYETCIGRKDAQDEPSEKRLTVGYELENSKFSLFSIFGNQYMVPLTLAEFFEHNINCGEKQSSAPAASREDYARWDALENRLADIELFLENLGNTSTEINAVAPQSLFINGTTITADDYLGSVAALWKVGTNRNRGDTDDLGEIETMVENERVELARTLVMSSPKYCGRGYIFDSCVKKQCSALLNKLPYVKYAKDYRMLDLTKRFGQDPHGSLNWPSFFIGSAGKKSRIHQDAEGTSFFLMIVAGRKVFRTVRAEDASLFVDHDVIDMNAKAKEVDEVLVWSMYERFVRPVEGDAVLATNSTPSSSSSGTNVTGSTSRVSRYDIFNPGGIWSNFSSQFTVYETVLEPGDIIFIPRWSLHSAINLVDGTISVSGNFYHETSLPMYREYCSSPMVKRASNSIFTCKWAGSVSAYGTLGSYGQAMYAGLHLLVSRARIEIGSRVAEIIRLLTSRIIDWGRTSLSHRIPLGGWQHFLGFPSSSPDECACCCSLDLPALYFIPMEDGDPLKFYDDENPLLWAYSLEVYPYYQCSTSFYTDLGIAESDIKPRMQSCFRREMWQRYQWMSVVGALPAIFVTVSTFVIAVRKGVFSGGTTSYVLKKE